MNEGMREDTLRYIRELEERISLLESQDSQQKRFTPTESGDAKKFFTTPKPASRHDLRSSQMVR